MYSWHYYQQYSLLIQYKYTSMMLGVITWSVDPILLEMGGLRIGWYGALFSIGLVGIGYLLMQRMWQCEKLPEEWLSKLFFVVILGTIVGARLGHVLFYDPGYYLANPGEILKVWHGGLASHGGTLGLLLGLWWYSRKVSHRSVFWIYDRLAVPTGIVAMMIRLGNLMNHEIYGHATDVPWAFRFITNIGEWRRGAEPIYSLPSHPTQLYEAACYLVIFLVCMWLYWVRHMADRREGFIFGVFITLVFGSRFVIEFVKNDQSAFEAGMAINMGQILSLPLIAIGIAAIIYSLRKQSTPTLSQSK